jgi:hypothetical protein
MFRKLILAALSHAVAMALIVVVAIGAIAMSKHTCDWLGGDQAIHTIIWLCLAFGLFGAVREWAGEDEQ